MATTTQSWVAGLAVALSVLGLGNTIYSTNTDTLVERLIRIEEEHKGDVADLRKKHDGDIEAVRMQMDSMEIGIHGKLDSILSMTSSIHVDVKVNASKISNLEKD